MWAWNSFRWAKLAPPLGTRIFNVQDFGSSWSWGDAVFLRVFHGMYMDVQSRKVWSWWKEIRLFQKWRQIYICSISMNVVSFILTIMHTSYYRNSDCQKNRSCKPACMILHVGLHFCVGATQRSIAPGPTKDSGRQWFFEIFWKLAAK